MLSTEATQLWELVVEYSIWSKLIPNPHKTLDHLVAINYFTFIGI